MTPLPPSHHAASRDANEHMNLFFSILAWTFLVLSILRIALIFWTAKHQADIIRVAEMLGENPVGRALVIPILTIITCLAWIISRWLA